MPRPLDLGNAYDEEKYTAVPVEYKEFPERPHFPGVPGWEEVADYALEWAEQHATTPARVSGATA